MRNFADRLLDAIDEKKNPSVVGLDPVIGNIPEHIRKRSLRCYGNTFEAVADAFIDFNTLIIDEVSDIVAVVKPQMAFYEKYLAPGIEAFKRTVEYAKEAGLIIIEDAKRNDIGSTAKAYSDGHIGLVELIDGKQIPGFDVDCITVNAYLGFDGVKPFIEDCKKFGKGIFILDKTSNPSSGDLQDKSILTGKIVQGEMNESVSEFVALYEKMAELINGWGKETVGERGYSSVGAVVGATYPGQAQVIRSILSKSIFLVPGYGKQGGGAKDALPCFNTDGYGAVINSSRGIIFAYQSEPYKNRFKPTEFHKAAREATTDMKEDITSALKEKGICPW